MQRPISKLAPPASGRVLGRFVLDTQALLTLQADETGSYRVVELLKSQLAASVFQFGGMCLAKVSYRIRKSEVEGVCLTALDSMSVADAYLAATALQSHFSLQGP